MKFNDFFDQHVPLQAPQPAVLSARAAARVLAMDVGWCDAAGNTSFISAADEAECIARIAEVAADKTRHAQVSRASLSAKAMAPEDKPVAISASSAVPMLAKIGDRCSACGGPTIPVGLANDRLGLYCTNDRVVHPLPPGHSM